jgi:murein DD-endopeptidase MepM/ murein hydrolase activator NlpD
VTFAGRNYSHANYGIFVVIEDDNGMYVSMSAHLSGLEYGIVPGARVTHETIIGYAGDTGDPSIPCIRLSTATPASTPTAHHMGDRGCR